MNHLYILSFISILGWTFFLSIKYKKIATIFPFFVTTSIISILYPGALMGTLFFTSGLVFVLGLMLPIYAILRLKITWKDIKNLPLSFYFLLFFGIIWFFFTMHATIFGWDEFFWGQFTKVILNTNKFYTNGSAILEGRIIYPPGVPLFQYFFLHFSRYSEGALYFSQGIIALSAVSLVFDLVGRNIKRLLIFTLAVVSALVYFGPGLLSIYNDHILGVVFAGAVLASVFILRTSKSKLLLIPVVFILPVIKVTGIILSLTVVMVVLVDLIISNIYQSGTTRQIKLNTVKFIILLTVILGFSAFLPMKSWDYYVKTQGVETTKTPGLSKMKESFSSRATEQEKLIIKNFNNAVISLSMNQQDGGYKSNNQFVKIYLKTIEKVNHQGLAIPWWLLVFSISFGIIVYFQKSKERIITLSVYFTLLVGLSTYLFMHLIAYIYHFSTYEAVNLASMSRYINSYILGFALITIGSVAVFMRNNIRGVKLLGTTSGVIFLYLLIFHTPPLFRLIIPPQIAAQSTNIVREKTRAVSDTINFNTESSNKIWVIYQNTNGWECMMVRYDIVPRRMNGGGGNWSLGDKYGPGDVWTTNLSKEEWSSQLLDEGYDYVYLAQTDDNFWSHYSELFKDPIGAKSHKLFRVELKDGSAQLVAK